MTELSTIPISRLNNAELDTKIKTEIDKNGTDLSTIATNCIVEIPQDIKLELNDGTLTVKAGSKVYVPNGFEADGTTLQFDEVIIDNDTNLSVVWGTAGFVLIYLTPDKRLTQIGLITERVSSGSTAPTATNKQLWYDTTNNIIKEYRNGSVESTGCSFPLALCTKADSVDSTLINSIDQIFNGFGYIGSTVFALPSIKGLIPNGRNADGTLKNIEVINSSVLINVFTESRDSWKMYLENTTPVRLRLSSGITYLEDVNRNHYDHTNGYIDVCYLGSVENVGSLNISKFNPKTTFHALDYNDRPTITYWE